MKLCLKIDTTCTLAFVSVAKLELLQFGRGEQQLPCLAVGNLSADMIPTHYQQPATVLMKHSKLKSANRHPFWHIVTSKILKYTFFGHFILFIKDLNRLPVVIVEAINKCLRSFQYTSYQQVTSRRPSVRPLSANKWPTVA